MTLVVYTVAAGAVWLPLPAGRMPCSRWAGTWADPWRPLRPHACTACLASATAIQHPSQSHAVHQGTINQGENVRLLIFECLKRQSYRLE